jgi:hypothetical protein
MLNGNSAHGGYGGDMACTVTGVQKITWSSPAAWLFLVVVWKPRR